jgi:hypothetical protein
MSCDRPVKIQHLPDEEVFHYSKFVTIIVVITSTLLISRPNYFKYEKVKSKGHHIHFLHYRQRVKRISKPKFLHVRLFHTEKILSFNCTRLLSGIYLLFQNLFRNNSEFLLWTNRCHTFNVHGSVYRKYIPISIQQNATLHNLFISGNSSTCFGWYTHPLSGAHTTVFTASDTCHTGTATCRYSGR